MTRFTDEQGWVDRLVRCGWEYKQAVDLIRSLHSGVAEEVVASAEEQWLRIRVSLYSVEVPVEAILRMERELDEELGELITPEALASLKASEVVFQMRMLGGDET